MYMVHVHAHYMYMAYKIGHLQIVSKLLNWLTTESFKYVDKGYFVIDPEGKILETLSW